MRRAGRLTGRLAGRPTRWRPGAFLALLLFLALPARAQGPWAFRLESPVRCDPPGACYVQNYVDHAQSGPARDFLGGGLTYCGHNGTDFRIPLAAMRAGTPVLAAVPGRVVRVIANEPDAEPEEAARKVGLSDWGAERPNLVSLDHGGGWITDYAHLRRGSVRVAVGQDVAAGQVLGLVGLSGRTSFPHVHLEVRWEGRPVDPFVGPPTDWPVRVRGPLWTPEALAAWPAGLVRELDAGFSSGPPDLQGLLRGQASPPPPDPRGPALVYWVCLLGPRAGDAGEYTLSGPDGAVLFARQVRYAESGPVGAEFVGLTRAGQAPWPAGNYTGRWTLRRRDSSGQTREFGGRAVFSMPGEEAGAAASRSGGGKAASPGG